MFKHIRTKLLALMIPAILIILILSYVVSVTTGKRVIDSQTNARILAEQNLQTSTIMNNLKSARDITGGLGAFVESTYRREQLSSYEELLSSVVEANPFILGAGIWFEPYRYDQLEKYRGPYVYRSKDSVITTYAYSNQNYNYLDQNYYQFAKEQKQVVFTDAYYDETSGFYMITCSRPMYDSDRTFLGCITVDIDVSAMQKLVSESGEFSDSHRYLISSDGTYLAAEDIALVKEGKSFADTSNLTFRKAAKEILSKKEGMVTYDKNGDKYRLYYKTLDELGWKLVFDISEASINQPVADLSMFFIMIGVLSFFLLGSTVFFVTFFHIARPIRFLTNEISKIGENEFDSESPSILLKRKDEFGLLGKSFGDMKIRLKQYQKELEESLDENIAANEELIQQNELLSQNEEILMESMQYNASMMEALPDMLFVLSKEGIFLDCQGNTEVISVHREYLVGKKVSEVFPPELADGVLQKIEDAILSNKLQTFEYESKHNGQSEYFELRIAKCMEDKVIAIDRSITELHNHVKEVEYLSYHDQITGLHNRRYFDKKLEEMNQTEYYPLSIIISDVNGLKMMNDSFGHDMGDWLLQKYAKVLKESPMDNEFISRIGGDEFAMVLPLTPLHEAERYVQDLQQRCSMEQINGITLSVSFGCGTLSKKEQSLRDIIKAAEDQMYQNKIFEAPSRRGKTIEVIVRTLQEKNPREEQHSHRVAEICEAMSIQIGMDAVSTSRVRNAGLLHDIGKIGIPEELLNKSGSLSEEEYQTICKHPEIGYRILQTAIDMSDISNMILSHHERWDGLGYPRGLAGEAIPYAARMIAIADSFDAMTSERTYRKAVSEEEAAEEIMRHAGTQFDPVLALVFVENVLGVVTYDYKQAGQSKY